MSTVEGEICCAGKWNVSKETTHCNTLQHTATRYTPLQQTAPLMATATPAARVEISFCIVNSWVSLTFSKYLHCCSTIQSLKAYCNARSDEVYIAIPLIFVDDASQCAQVCCKDMGLSLCV